MSDERVGLCGEHCAVVDECDARGREILRLRAENEKLRAALKPFSQWSFEKYDGDDPVILELVSDLRAAAAALKETGDE